MDKNLINKAEELGLKEGDIIIGEKSECCNADIKYTENSGVYICPGIYCSKCDKLLYE